MPSFAAGRELAGLGGVLRRFVAAPLTGAALFNWGRDDSVLNKALQSIPSTKKTDAGRAAGNELQYIGGQLMQGQLPYSRPAVGSIPPSANGESYRRAELRLGDAARAGGGGGGGGNAGYSLASAGGQSGGSTPADRAYQQEKARVAQMTEQDPMFKKYQVAELTKAYNTASPEEKNKIGLQIWAATNPTLAKKVPPGQVGRQTSASMFGSQAFGTDVPGVTETIYSQAGQQAGIPGGVQFPGAEQAAKMNAFSMGADAQQLGVTPPGSAPYPMIGENVFKRGFEVPSSEDLSQTQLALLKRAFESRIK